MATVCLDVKSSYDPVREEYKSERKGGLATHIALLDAHTSEDIGDLAHFPKQFRVRNVFRVSRFVSGKGRKSHT